MKIYVTKYAATRGIIEVEAKDVGAGSVLVLDGGFPTFYHAGEWASDLNTARKQAIERIERKAKSAQKQADKLAVLLRNARNGFISVSS